MGLGSWEKKGFLFIFPLRLFMERILPKDLEAKMEKSPEIGWSFLVRRSIMKKLEEIAFMEFFTSESEITEEEAIKLGKELDKKLIKLYE